MGIDLDLLADGDMGLALGDWAMEEPSTRERKRETADDAMAGFWSALDDDMGGGGGGSGVQPWWELSLDEDDQRVGKAAVSTTAKPDTYVGPVELLLEEQEAALAAFAQPTAPSAISPVSMIAKHTHTSADTELLSATDSPFAAASRQMEVSDDSQTESGSDSGGPKPVTPPSESPKARSTSRKSSKGSNGNVAVKTEPATTKQESSKKPKRKRKAKATGATAAAAAKSELAWDEKHLTPLEIRRKRNRESMQRARRRQRDDVEQMKGTLQQLERHYQTLNEQSQARRRLSSSGSSGGDAESLAREAEYYALADLSHTLKEEKFLLEQMLVDKQKTHRRLQQVMVDRKQELSLACPLSTDDATLFSDFEFSPMTEDQANEHIRQCYQRMRLMEETGKPILSRDSLSEVDQDSTKSSKGKSKAKESKSTSATAEEEGGSPFPASATFGWDVRYESTPTGEFYASFAKFFPGVTPQQAMMSSWNRYADPTSYSSPFRRMVRFEMLQVINDSTYIAGSDIEHPVKHGKLMRMMFLHFRMQTEKGFVIGRYSVNPTAPEVRALAEQNSSFEYVDSSNWVEFSEQNDPDTGAPGCRVKFLARTEYNTQEDLYVRLVNSISRTMLWELAVVPSSLSLLRF